MKLLRLDLRAFGGFSHKVFNFDPKKRIHVLYGQNEAGKSSFTRALKALLFGIEKKSQDAYLHPQENLFLEGLLEGESGKIHQIIRDSSPSRKQNQLLLKLFPKLDKQSFTNLFCLDQETIRMGSKDLLENIKHFDISLISSLQGAGGIINLLKAIEKDIEELYKARGVKPYLNQRIQEVSNLLTEKESLQLSLPIWQELGERKGHLQLEHDQVIKEYREVSSLDNDLSVLIDIFELLPRFLGYDKSLKKFDTGSIISKEALLLYNKLNTDLKNLKSEKEKTHHFIKELEGQVIENAYDPVLVDLKVPFEILSLDSKHYEEWIADKNKHEEELQGLRDKFKNINLDLQEKINVSISHKTWIEIRTKLLEVIKEISITRGLTAEKSNQIQIQKENLKALKWKDAGLPSHKDIDSLEDGAKAFEPAIVIEKEVEELASRVTFSLEGINSDPIKKEMFTQAKFQEFLEESGGSLKDILAEFSAIKHEYFNLLIRFKDCEAKLESLGNEDRVPPEFDFEGYLETKKKRQVMAAELTKPWDASNYTEKYTLFLNYQQLLDEEDAKETYFFSNLEKLALHKKLLLDRVESARHLKVYQEALFPLKERMKTFYILVKTLIKEIDLYDYLQVEALFKYMSKLDKLASLLHTSNQLMIKRDALREKLSKYTTLDNTLPNLKIRFLNNIKSKKLEILAKSELKHKISFISNSIKIFENELEDANLRIDIFKSEWEKVALKNSIKIDFDPNAISSSIKSLDQFFELSKVITQKNDLVKNNLKLIQKFEKDLEKLKIKSSFTDLNSRNIWLYIEKIKGEAERKIQRDQLLFLKSNKLKDVDVLRDKECKSRGELEVLLTKLGLEDDVTRLNASIVDSNQFHSIKDAHDEVESLLSLKTKPKNLKDFILLKNDFQTLEELVQTQSNVRVKVAGLLIKKESLQKEMGEINYQEREINSFSKKYELDQKLQAETYDLNEKIDEYVTASTSAKMIKKFIWEFQQQNHHEVLKKAGKLFQIMTQGKYHDVQLNILNQKDSFLICENNKSQKVTVDCLSEGTRDQLFLSLKLAMGELYSQKQAMFPVILDDVFVNFDDERARCSLEVLDSMSSHSQIILLTHHKHILELIKQSKISSCAQFLDLGSAEFATP